MAGRYVGFGKKLFDLALGRGKSNVSTTIVGVDVAKNLATKRKIQDNVVSAVDSAFKKANVPPSLINQQKKAKLKKDESKKLKDVSYKLDKLEEKVKKRNEGSSKLFKAFKGRKFNKGGRVGLKKGSFPDLSGDGKTTFKDILIGRGVIKKGKKKTMMAKKSKSPMDKTVRKS